MINDLCIFYTYTHNLKGRGGKQIAQQLVVTATDGVHIARCGVRVQLFPTATEATSVQFERPIYEFALSENR
jgi:hypothetical protein